MSNAQFEVGQELETSNPYAPLHPHKGVVVKVNKKFVTIETAIGFFFCKIHRGAEGEYCFPSKSARVPIFRANSATA